MEINLFGKKGPKNGRRISVSQIERRQQRGRRRRFLRVGLFVVLVVVLAGGTLFLVRRADTLRDGIVTQRKLASAIQQRIAVQDSLREDYKRVKDVIPKMDTALPREEDVPSILGNIEDVADSLDLTVSAALGEEQTTEGTRVFPVQLRGSMSFGQFESLLRELIALPHPLGIDSFKVSSSAGIEKQGTIEINAVLFLRP